MHLASIVHSAQLKVAERRSKRQLSAYPNGNPNVWNGVQGAVLFLQERDTSLKS